MAKEIVVTKPTDNPADPELVETVNVDQEGKVIPPPEPAKPAEEEKAEKLTEEAAKPAEEEKPAAEPEETKEKKGGFQKRIDKLTAEKYRLQAQLEQALAQGAKPSEPPPPPPAAKPKPKPEDFEEYDAYVEAVTDYKVEQKVEELRFNEAQATQASEARETMDNFRKNLEKTRTKYEDWDEVAAEANVTIPPIATNAIFSLENGPDVVYHLAKNREVAESLSEMSELEAVMEIGRISASLQGEAKGKEAEKTGEKKPPVATAPAPIKPVGGSSTKHKLPLSDPQMKDRYREYQQRREAGET